jgi:hypothetical protein
LYWWITLIIVIVINTFIADTLGVEPQNLYIVNELMLFFMPLQDKKVPHKQTKNDDWNSKTIEEKRTQIEKAMNQRMNEMRNDGIDFDKDLNEVAQ